MTDDNEEFEGEKKTFTFWILLNWKTEDIKLYKRKPADKKVGAYNIPVEVSLDVLVPKKPDVEAKGEIVLGKDKVKEMTVESI